MNAEPATTGSDAVELLIVGIGRLVTMDEQRRVLTGAALAVGNGRIIDLGDEGTLRRRYLDAATLDAHGGWVVPGFVDAHQHLTGDRLARASIPDTLAPGAAIFEWAVPLHAAHTADDDHLSASLAALEAVSNGVTTLIEAGTVAPPRRRGRGGVRRGDPDLDRPLGMGRGGGPVCRSRGGGRRPCGGVARPVPTRRRWTRAGLGDAGRPRPDVGFTFAASDRSGTRARRAHDVPPLAE